MDRNIPLSIRLRRLLLFSAIAITSAGCVKDRIGVVDTQNDAAIQAANAAHSSEHPTPLPTLTPRP